MPLRKFCPKNQGHSYLCPWGDSLSVQRTDRDYSAGLKSSDAEFMQ
jgi:hypothetical protein